MLKKGNSINAPEAFITKNKKRVKQYYDSIVYLKNGDEFEIELFNPTSERILAKITVNGKSIGPGIILKPGEREFLDRYTSDPNKFLFDTYLVDSSNDKVKKATENNGVIGISFYRSFECSYNSYTMVDGKTLWDGPALPLGQKIYYDTSNGNNTGFKLENPDIWVSSGIDLKGINTWASSNTSLYASTNKLSSTTNINNPNVVLTSATSEIPKQMETGRVEKGSYSNQKLKTNLSLFESSSSWYIEWKLLPESNRNINKSDLTTYCEKCGRKQRKNENFCPSCGNKFNKNESNVKIEIGDTVVIKSKNAISVVNDISLDGEGNEIYFVKYPNDNRWYRRTQIEFSHKNF